MKLAIIETGGKQYKVSPGDRIKIEKLPGDPKKGDTVTFDKVLLWDDGEKLEIGVPYVSGKTVKGELEGEGRNPKVITLKYKAKARQRNKYGHRQPYSIVKIQK